MGNKGWVKIHRSVMDNDIWKKKPFSEGQAWVDLILLADHEDIGKYKKGSVYKSQYKLASRWGWSRGKVRRFLELLLSQEMILLNSLPYGTTITLVKYGFYQNGEPTKKPTKKPTNDTTNGTYTRNKEIDKPLIDSGIVIIEEDDGFENPLELLKRLKAEEGSQ